MPAVVAGAALSGGMAFATGATIGTLSVTATAFVVAGANLAMGLVSQKMGKQRTPAFTAEARDRVQAARTTAAERTLVFGESQISGPLCLFESTGSANEYLHLVVPHADHPCAGAQQWFLNDEAVGTLDGSGNVTSGRFDGHARLVFHDGAFDQAAAPNLVSEIASWSSSHKGGGVGYTEARLKWSQNVWPNGFNNLKLVMQGALLYDPRDTGVTILASSAASPAVFTTDGAHGFSVGTFVWIKDHAGAVPDVWKIYQIATTPASDTFTLIDEDGNAVNLSTGGSDGTVTAMVWSDNWALCVRHWLAHRDGFNALNSEIDDTQVAAAANICDEQVALTTEDRTFTASASADTLALASSAIWRTGDGITVASTGTLPGGLAAATTYYCIRVDKDTVKLATTLENARAGTAIDLTDAGSGTHTATRNSQLRYTCNGVVKLGVDPMDVLEDLMTAAAGVVVWEAGTFKVYAGAATASSGTLDENDLSGGLEVLPSLPMGELFNAARGTFVDPDKYWTEADLKPYTNATYEAEDNGERIYRDFQFPFTTDPTAGQRLLKIALERARQGATLEWRAKPAKFATAVWDVEAVSVDHLGWAAKEFRVMAVKEGQDFSLGFTLREEAAAVWDWSLGDETAVDLAPNSNLPDPFTVANPTGLALASGTDHLDTRLDGTIFSRIHVSWTAPADAYVTDGGRIEVQYKKSADSDWSNAPSVPGDETFSYLLDVKDGVSYDVRIRSVNAMGVRPETWVSDTHTVAGKSADPSDVTSLFVQQNGEVVTCKWPAISDADRAGYAIRFMASPFVWEDATPISDELIARGTLITTALVPPGDWVFGIKAVDTSGNESANAPTASLSVVNSNDVVLQSESASRWSGTLTNMVKHWTGKLVPESQDLANANDNHDVFDNFCETPYATCSFEASALDLGFDADGVRVWADIVSVQGPGETTGTADPQFQIDYRDDAGSFDGFEDWGAGSVDFRHLKPKFEITTANGLPVVSGFNTVCDVAETEQRGEGVAVAVSGTAITFDTRFHGTPNVQVTVQGTTALFAVISNITATGFTVQVFNSSGTDVGGTVDWVATGA